MAKRVRGTTEVVDRTARELRREATFSERVLWQKLRNRQIGGAKFRRQHPVGQVICDFCCPEKRLIVEVDGPVHQQPEQVERDTARTRHLESYGYTVLRFGAEEVEDDPAAVTRQIRAALADPAFLPLSQNWERGRGVKAQRRGFVTEAVGEAEG